MDWKAIDAEYHRLGHKGGWVFGMSPIDRMASARNFFIGLNPGGEPDDSDREFETVGRNAYLHDRWTTSGDPTPIQAEIRAIHTILKLVEKETFAAQFIPFRSKSVEDLPRRIESLEFSRKLWNWVRLNSNPQILVCMGSLVFWEIRSIWAGGAVKEAGCGWGNVKLRQCKTDGGAIILGIPHPSRFRLYASGDPKVRDARAQVLRSLALQTSGRFRSPRGTS